MKYLLPIIIFISFVLPLWGAWRYCSKIKFDFIYKILNAAIWKKINTTRKKAYFSSLTIESLALFLNSQKRKDIKKIINAIKKNDFNPLLKKIDDKKNSSLKADFDTIFSGKAHLASTIESQIWLFLQKGNFSKAQKLLKADSKNKNHYLKALRNYCNGCLQMQEGDLLSASENFAVAAAIFKKIKTPFEEAMCYLMNGTVYRVCGLQDISRLMLFTSRKIFASVFAKHLEAEVVGNLGMLMVMQNSFDEAEEYFEEAKNIFLQNNLSQGIAEILNQQALSFLIQGDNKKALATATKALKIHREIKNLEGEAFSLEILAHNAVEQKKWKDVIKFSSDAEKLYVKTKNIAALREVLFLQARGMFETNNLQKSEKFLRHIIDDSKKQNSAFHVANAYNLLGLIYLKKGDLRRAKGIFQQSLQHEINDDRTDGAAIDYANIALIDYMNDQKDQSKKTFATALEYAKVFEEGEVFNLIKKSQAQH